MSLIETSVNFGGDIQLGDFVCIANSNTLDFGWFCGRGIGGTFQYYHVRQPMWSKTYYDDARADVKHWNHKKEISRQFSTKVIAKSFLTGYHHNTSRIMKVTWDVRDIFTDVNQLSEYQKSKQILEEINFLKQ